MADLRNVPVLFDTKENCCGCGACLNVCPKNAVSMAEDSSGYIYPQIDESLCVRCGKCKEVCAYQNSRVENSPIKTWAAVSRNSGQAEKSASGGIFAALAEKFIKEGGAVYGAAMNEDFTVSHTRCESADELERLQGSKYTQSSTGQTFREVKKLLTEGRQVLFSGTPCQVDGLKGYLGRAYDNLLTVDIICHGVPNNRMFRDYIGALAKKNGGEIENFTFRDKSIGWGINGSCDVSGRKVKLWQSASSYIFYFMKGWIYRENCYGCKYACEHRPADITLGDFWGIEKQHPDYLGKGGWDEAKGISVIIANTEKGLCRIESSADILETKPSDFEKAAKGNAQLVHPASKGKRDEIVPLFESGGWSALDERFNKNIGFRKHSSAVKNKIPAPVKRLLKSIKK